MIKKLGKIAALSSLLFTSSLLAEIKELVISKQYGVGTIPFIIIEEQKLIEKYAKESGLGDIKVNWATLGGGAAANDALLSGNAHIVSAGTGPFLRLWDKTQGKVKGLTALNEAPFILVSNDPNLKTIKDLTEKDKIAIPAVKVSIQSLILQMAAAKEYGIKNYDKFDHLTVGIKHPDAYLALSGENSKITGHFGVEPYTTLELDNPKLHGILNSYDLIGEPHTSVLVYTTDNFYKENPKLSKSIVKALNEANKFIKENQDEVVKIYLKSTNSKEPPETISKILKNTIVFDTQPRENLTKFSDFLYDVGAIKKKPSSWEELFFDSVK